MMCAWKDLISILPPWLRSDVDELGRDTLNELRLRINAPPELIMGPQSIWLNRDISLDDLNFVINSASRYSPWAASTISQGFITSAGGHRIGIGGTFSCRNGIVENLRQMSSLCIRVARDFIGIGKIASAVQGSVLILGAPGWGKTTLLRDMVRCFSENESTSVIDERGELFPDGLIRGKKMDVFQGCPKQIGIEMALRTMRPSCIAVDEITAHNDCRALINAANCGVRLVATAHAASVKDFRTRTVYRPLIEHYVFDTLIVMNKDRTYEVERMLQ